MVLGDVDARVLFYYVALKSQWLLRYQSPLKVEKLKTFGQNYSPQLLSQFYGHLIVSLCQW